MKASELMINRNYLFNGNEQVMTPNKLKAVIQTGDYDSIQPIPLTEEWLEKFGFVCTWCGQGDGQTWELNTPNQLPIVIHGDMYPLYFDYSENGSWMYGAELKYVHQLQNLYFALTGQELKIKEYESK